MSEIQDVVINRIREVRHQISEQHGHDPQRLINYYLELQQQFTEQLLEDDHLSQSEANSSFVSAINLATSSS
ncbi:MAG: hypothetical protein ACLFTI_09130 [Anaerolineales bacterium]